MDDGGYISDKSVGIDCKNMILPNMILPHLILFMGP